MGLVSMLEWDSKEGELRVGETYDLGLGGVVRLEAAAGASDVFSWSLRCPSCSQYQPFFSVSNRHSGQR